MDGFDKEGKLWQQSLGSNWKTIHERRLHTLSNLTLSGYNPELSNRNFSDKKKEYAKSNVGLTRELANLSDWTEDAIRTRGEKLSLAAINLWSRPTGGDKYTPTTDLGLEEIVVTEPDQTNTGRYIVVTIDWNETGRSIPREIIANSVAAETMVRFIGRLITVLGDEAAIKLSQLRISRGPLLTRNPKKDFLIKKDFLNSAKGNLYAHKQVPGTTYYVLTHSATKEKVEQMRLAADVLEVSQAIRINLADGIPDEA